MKQVNLALLCHGNNIDRLKEVMICMIKQYPTEGWEYVWNCYYDSSLTETVRSMAESYGFNMIPSEETQWGKFIHITEEDRYDKIAFCSSDDLWTYQKIEYQLKLDEDVIISAYVSQSPDRFSWFEHNTPVKFRHLPFLTFCVWSGWMFDGKVRIPDILGFHNDYGIEQYILSCLLTKYDIYVMLNPLFAFTVHDRQLTNAIDENAKGLSWKKFIDGFVEKIESITRHEVRYLYYIPSIGYLDFKVGM